jgi:hypothetical protein
MPTVNLTATPMSVTAGQPSVLMLLGFRKLERRTGYKRVADGHSGREFSIQPDVHRRWRVCIGICQRRHND